MPPGQLPCARRNAEGGSSGGDDAGENLELQEWRESAEPVNIRQMGSGAPFTEFLRNASGGRKQSAALSVVSAICADMISYTGQGKLLYSIFSDEMLTPRPWEVKLAMASAATHPHSSRKNIDQTPAEKLTHNIKKHSSSSTKARKGEIEPWENGDTQKHKQWSRRLKSRQVRNRVKRGFSSVARSCPTPCDPMDCSTPGLPVYHQLPELAQTHIHRVGDTIEPSYLCCPFLLLPSIFPSIRVFSNESTLPIRWPKFSSFSFSISPSNEYSELISFRINWFDFLAVQGTLRSLLQHHSSKASILQSSAFFIVQLSHPYMTAGKSTALTRWIFVGKVMSLLLNILSRLVINFLPRSKRVF